MVKQKCRFIFKTNGTLKWSNLILHISEFFIRVNMCHFLSRFDYLDAVTIGKQTKAIARLPVQQ